MTHRRNFRRKELAASISLLLAAYPALYAQGQEAAAPADADQESPLLEEVVVTASFRTSLMNQIDIKRENTSIVDAISAEDIGKLPDSSIAESLARLPGVSGERRNGRVSGISVRGFKEDYVGTTLNGRELLGMGDNRGVEYDLYPAEIVSSMVVYKTPDAGHMVQGIGGIVDINTTRPLEAEPYFVINGTYEQNDMESANPDYDDSGHRLALSYSNFFAGDTLGISFAVATTESPSQEQQFRGWGYPTIGGSATAGSGVTLNGDEVVLGGHDSFVRSAVLERDTLSGVLQWAPSDDLTLTLDALYIDFNEEKVFRGVEEAMAEWGGGNYTVTGVEPGFVSSGQIDGGFKSVIRNDGETKDSNLTTFGANIEWKLSDAWAMEFDGAYSDVEKTITNIESYSGVGRANLMSQGPNTNRSWLMTPTGVLFSPHPSFPDVDLTDFDLIRLAGPQAWGGAMAPIQQFAEVTLPDGSKIGYPQAQDGFVNEPSFDEDLTTLRLDATRALDGFFQSLEFGLNYSDRSKTKDNRGFYLTAPTWPTDGPIPEEYRVGTADLSFIGIPGVVAYDGLGLYQSGYYIASDAQQLETGRLGDSYTVDEEIYTFFTQLNFDRDLGNGTLYGNAGLQYVDVDQSSSGFGTYTGPDLYVLATPITDGDTYSDWLPSLNLNWDLNNGHLLRFAASKVMSRPRMDDMRSNQQVSFSFNIAAIDATDPRNSAWSGSAGNARLKPLEADQLDLAWDWYFTDIGDGLFSTAVFYKDLKNWHRAGQFIADFSQYFIPGYHQVVDAGGVVHTPATFQGLVSYREDGLTGDVTGVEMQTIFPFRILWDALDGFGAIATATFLDGELDDGSGVPGLSDENYSLTLFYERGGFQARVAWTDRSEFVTETRGLSLSLSPTIDQGGSLVDAQVSYNFGNAGFEGALGGLSIALQGQNLTDEDTIQANADSRQVTLYQSFGANYLLTAIYKFR